MPASAGPLLDREIASGVLGDRAPRVPAYSTENAAADLLLWRLAQAGVAFRVQWLDGEHFCVLWKSSQRGAATGSAASRPLAICRAALELLRVSAAPPSPPYALEARRF
jgi:hypothetical protein